MPGVERGLRAIRGRVSTRVPPAFTGHEHPRPAATGQAIRFRFGTLRPGADGIAIFADRLGRQVDGHDRSSHLTRDTKRKTRTAARRCTPTSARPQTGRPILPGGRWRRGQCPREDPAAAATSDNDRLSRCLVLTPQRKMRHDTLNRRGRPVLPRVVLRLRAEPGSRWSPSVRARLSESNR